METGIGLVKTRFNTLFLFFINWIGCVISLDCQYIFRVAEESFIFIPSFQNQIANFLHVQYKDYFRLWLFHRNFCAQPYAHS